MHLITAALGKFSIFPAALIHGLTNFVSLYLSHHYQTSPDNRAKRAAIRLLNFIHPTAPLGSLAYLAARWYYRVPPTENVYQQFEQDYIAKEPISLEMAVAEIPSGSSLPPVESTEYPTEVRRGFMKVWMDGMEFDLEEVKSLLKDFFVGKPPDHQIHPLLINNGLMYTPANSMNNLLSCLLYRIHNDPFQECPEPRLRWGNWIRLMESPLAKQFIIYFNTLCAHEKTCYPSMEEIVKIMGQKGRRIEVCNKRLEEGEEMPPAKSYNVKWNETIPLRELSPGVFDIKPRAICNLDPSVITVTTQLARYITNTCHLIFDGKNSFDTPFGCLKIVFASGYNQAQLSKMFIQMLEAENFLAVAGDDSIYKISCEDGTIEHGEADFKAFDQSEDDGPNRFAFAHWMKEIGIEKHIIDAIIWIFAKGYKVPPRNARNICIVGSGGLQLPTGHTFTTVLNSLNNIFSYMSAWQTKPFDFPKAALLLGFTAKMRIYGSDYRHLSFLKGWWIPTNIGFVWVPLPSAVIKVGKFLKPLSYFEKKGNPIPICSAMIVNSYFGVDRNYPIFGPFLSCLDRFKSKDPIVSHENVNENDFKPRLETSNYEMDVEATKELIMFRYGIDEADINQVADLYRQVKTLPSYVQHPVFEVLKQVDYM
jgi:hypothetical protein